MNKEVPQERLEGYISDFNKIREEEAFDFKDFWPYVAGREHGKEIHPAPVPIKASWYKDCGHVHSVKCSCRKIDYAHPLEIVPDEK